MVSLAVTIMALCAAVAALWRAFTDHRRLKSRLHEMELRAEKIGYLLRAQGSLAEDLAHEIKNPITAILCSADALDHLIGGELQDNHRKCLTYIRDYGSQLLRLLTDFLELSKLEAGTLQAQKHEIEVASLLNSVAALLKGLAQKKHIMIEIDAPETGLMVFGDTRYLKQSVFNLLSLTLHCAAKPGKVCVAARSEGNEVAISIAPADLSYRELIPDLDRSEAQEGRVEQDLSSRLAVRVCKGLIELQSGRLSVEPLGKEQTKIVINLPGRVSSAKLVSAHKLPSISSLDGQRVLLVGDIHGARESIGQLIQALGGVVHEVERAAEAVEALAAVRYDAVMLDSSAAAPAPKEVLKAITGEAHQAHIPVIVTANDSSEEERAYGWGADTVVEKPLTADQVVRTLLTRINK